MGTAVTLADCSAWEKNPDVQEVIARNREAKQARCMHRPTGPAWDAICTRCFKRLGYDEAVQIYERLDREGLRP